ncbi:uncharacterized protein M6B38_146545 [Iris pallida]|uniref:Transmembrane protein 131-like N-terminal domain-containing protein n=1 Tax=Iris pallida TaxID=29817 RepID=A0AAX6FAA9_IRIPA|nr:uncharacterized protein M6B38_146545 [Iris pallida]
MEEDAHPSSETKGRNIGCHHLFVVMLSVVICVLTLSPCAAASDFPVSCTENAFLFDGFQDFTSSSAVRETFSEFPELETSCPDSETLCFPSTLVNLEGIHDCSSNTGAYGSCERKPLLDPQNRNPDVFAAESEPPAYLEISPPLLDWGTSSLLSPALVYLRVVNTHNSSALHVFEPFSTDEQFYQYAFEELYLAPGEGSSIAFVFLPRLLGPISGQIVLQTNRGGFVVRCRGLGVESPYGVEPFGGFDVAPDGRLTWKLSLYNPFDDGLYVEEVSAQVSVYTETTSSYDDSTCSVEVSNKPSRQFGSFCKAGERGLSWMEDRPKRQWEVPPRSSETIVKVNLWPPVKGRVSGVICMKLWNSTRETSDTVIVPLGAEVDGRANYISLSGSVSVFLDSFVPWNGRGMVCSVSLQNGASDLLSVVHIAESSKAFEVKYTKGLLLYPGSITQAAWVNYNLPIGSEDSVATGISWESLSCKFSIVTNDSLSPQIMIPCQELVHACHRLEAFSGSEGLYIGVKSQEGKEKVTNARTGSLEGIIKESLPLKSKLKELLEADQLILRNWKSQGTVSKLSVLKDHELLFPVVQIGTQISKWITVHNPSENPVVMQLLLNPGTIIDQCKYPGDSFNPLFVNISTIRTQDGFLLPESATIEAFVQPFGSALFGPVLFQPSKQCRWRGSVLIRNNLSGVEWLPIQAFGGSYSLLLLEGSKLVKQFDFNLSLLSTINLSSPDSLFSLGTISTSCGHRLYKEVYIQNAGELPLEVIKLEVSGSNCDLDGFMMHTCKGFSLEPGGSVRLLMSYKPDFSAAVVLRYLNLITVSGVLLIPMKASVPIDMINLCKKSLFWTVMWKVSALIFTVVSIVCLLLFILLHPIPSATEHYSIKSENTTATSSKIQKPSRIHRNARKSKSIKKDEKPEEGMLISGYSHSEICVQENIQKMENKDSVHPKKSAPQSPSDMMSVRVPDSSGTSEASEHGNLTVRVMKERRRRRKQRAGGGGLASTFEVSSSQSGNSTPSSPMSPNVFTPNSSYSSFSGVLGQQNQQYKQDVSYPMEAIIQEPQKSSGKPILLTSATFPTSGWRAPGASTSNFLASTSPIPPYARAPGSKLSREETMRREEDDVFGKDFTYNIWGNNFCDHFMGKPKEFSPKVFDASEGDSQSFFARDLQSHLMMSSAQSVSPGHKLPPYDVNYVNKFWGNNLCDHFMGKPKEFSPKVFDASEGDSQSFFARDPQSLMMMPSAQSVSPGHKLPPYDVDYINEMD